MADDGNAENRRAFEGFLRAHLEDPEFRDRFVAFVHGKFQGAADAEGELIRRIYGTFGNVEMYVGRVSGRRTTVMVDTLEAEPPVPFGADPSRDDPEPACDSSSGHDWKHRQSLEGISEYRCVSCAAKRVDVCGRRIYVDEFPLHAPPRGRGIGEDP